MFRSLINAFYLYIDQVYHLKLFLLILFIFCYFSGSCQTLQCGQSGVPTLGQPFELNCTLTGQATSYYMLSLKKATVNFMQIPTFEPNSTSTFYNDGLSGRHSALVTVSPGVSRTVTVKFSTLECIDNGVYNWEISFFTTELTTLRQQQTLTLKGKLILALSLL